MFLGEAVDKSMVSGNRNSIDLNDITTQQINNHERFTVIFGTTNAHKLLMMNTSPQKGLDWNF
jgi:hypothetical protein